MNQLTPEQLDMIKRLQPLFREKMGVITEGDMFLNPFRKKICFVDKGTLVINGCFVIPKPIDWQNPERGLDGMIDWTQWSQARSLSGELYIEQRFRENGVAFIGYPFTALLKALCEQEGV